VSSVEGNGFPAATKNGEIKAAKINYRAQKKLSYMFEYNILALHLGQCSTLRYIM